MLAILVDENIPLMTLAALRQRGHDVVDVRGTALEGASDAALWRLAQGQGRLLITTDRGFASERHAPHFGVLIVRLRKPNRHRLHERIVQVLARFPPNSWPGRLVVARDTVLTVWPHSVWSPAEP